MEIVEDITNLPTEAELPPLAIQPRRRFLRISWFFALVILHVFFFDILGGRFRLTRWYTRRSGLRRWSQIARNFRALAGQRGGVLIKLGQFLSSRADILPVEITDELAGLQDEVPPAPLPYILQTLRQELRAPLATLFTSFDRTPVAAASLGQVYFATLQDGRSVAVKVQRPRIDEIVEIDLAATLWAVRVVKNYPLIKRRADLEALFLEFARVLRNELDYEQEAQNALAFRKNFADTPGIYFPEPYPELSSRRVLVMERIGGFKITDYAAIQAAGADRAELAERFNRAFLKQFFIDGVFHADPHPGNLFVRIDGPPSATAPAPATIILVDSGMVGRITPRTMSTLREGIVGLATNDADRIVGSMDQLGMLLPSTDRRQITQALQIILRYTYDRTVKEMTNVDVDAIFAETEHLVREMPFQIPQDLIYLGRAVSMVAGIATGLYPDLNVFASARPFAQTLVDSQRGELNLLETAQRELTALGQIAITLPRQLDTFLKNANRGELRTQVDFGRLERGMRRLERGVQRLVAGVIAGALFIGGAMLRTGGAPTEAGYAWAVAALLTLWALWPRGER